MGIRSASDLFYVSVARLPFLALIGGVVWFVLAGMAELEAISFGTEWFVGNDQTDNLMDPIGGGSYEEQLLAALETGDPAAMQAALDRVETQQQAIASHSLGN